MKKEERNDLTRELLPMTPAMSGLRSVWQWRPLASITPRNVADILRRAARGDMGDFLAAAADVEEKDLHYRAVLQTRRLSVSSLPVEVLARDDSQAAVDALGLAREALAALDMPAIVDHLMQAVALGFAVAEIQWTAHGAQWLPQVFPRPAQWFQFDQESGRVLRIYDGSREGEIIPPYRAICHTPGAHLPAHAGVARSALWAWVFKSYALRDWARFIELFGQPIRVGKYHQGASKDDVAVLKQAAFSLGSDAAAVIPEEMMLELVEAGGKSASGELYARLIEYLDAQVSKAVLGQTMTTDDGASLSQAKVHNEVRMDIMRADARAIAATLQRDLIAPLVALNLGTEAPLPVVELVVEEAEDRNALAAQVAQLAGAGLEIPQAWVREQFCIPHPEKDDSVLGTTPTFAPAAQSAHAKTGGCDMTEPVGDEKHRFSSGPQRGDVEQFIAPATHPAPPQSVTCHAAHEPQTEDLQAAQLAAETGAAWRIIFDRIRTLVEQADSLETLQAALLMEYGALPTDELAEIMATAFAAADLAGRFEVTKSGRD